MNERSFDKSGFFYETSTGSRKYVPQHQQQQQQPDLETRACSKEKVGRSKGEKCDDYLCSPNGRCKGIKKTYVRFFGYWIPLFEGLAIWRLRTYSF